ncbi:MAG: efflux RND transporter periplasmic adaptor subunit [Acidobacteria bacterium]|nr:MAG: efflux RND transporter periplasmic adaptor subunit [Acidobacteriota bacterium]
MTTRRLLPIPSPGALALLALTACGVPPAAQETPARPPAIAVRVATAERAEVPEATVAAGSVEALRRVRPGSKILGRVERVLVREGEKVRRGQLLATIESRDLEAAVAQARASLAMADAELDNARVHARRMAELHRRGAVTDKSLEDATARFAVATAAREQAQANLEAAEVALSYARVTSPIDGWVVTKAVEAGDVATPGTPFFTLDDLSRVKVTAEVPEAEVAGLAPGSPARVDVLGSERPATVDRVVPAGDRRSRTFAVQLLLDNPDAALKSGMFARVRFPRRPRQALLVPGDALVERGPLEGLFVAGDDGRARLRWVKSGRRHGGRVEILSGLEVGERYLLRPPPGLADGAAIEVTP